MRWRGGRSETVCPLTVGLDQGYNDFVSARVRAVAAFVGAPVQSDDRAHPTCRSCSRPTLASRWSPCLIGPGNHGLSFRIKWRRSWTSAVVTPFKAGT